MRRLLFVLIAVPALLVPVAGQRSTLCGGWQDCRRLALEAKERGDVDRFHDLAWAAAQAGPKNDPDLMYLVARAQAVSGRPHNALVMLQRLTDAGVAIDADTDPDFEQPRLLPDWPQVAAAIARVRAAPTASVSAVSSPAGASAGAATAARPAAVSTPAAASRAAPSAAAPVAAPAAALPAAVPVAVTEAGSFSTASTPPFVSAGLAYDVVSQRFVIGDAHGQKLVVVAAGATHADVLARLDSRFGDLAALGIDEQRGTLWVAGSSGGGSELQRLQLVSGRVLRSYHPQASAGSTRLVDLAILGSGEVIALDSAGSRLLSLTTTGTELTVVMALNLSGVTSLARRDDNLLYVAHDDGIARIDLRSRAVSPVSVSGAVAFGRFDTIRMHRDTLIGLQATPGSSPLIRLTLNGAGRSVTSAAPLDAPSSTMARRLSLAISGDNLYYLAGPSTQEAQFVIRRIGLTGPAR